MSVRIKALSVTPRWAWAIIHAGKDIENRTWYTSYRGPLAIHASKTNDEADLEYIMSRGVTPPGKGTLVTGAVIGIVRLMYCFKSGKRTKWGEPGCFHWGLTEARPIEPIPLRGQLGLFEVEIQELEEVING